MRRIPALLVAVALSSCQGGGEPSPSAKSPSTVDGPVVVVDVRTPEEYASGHVKDARLIDFHGPDFDSRLASLPRDTAIVLYCRSGNRSGKALAKLQDLGFTNARHVPGGIGNWSDPNRPIVE